MEKPASLAGAAGFFVRVGSKRASADKEIQSSPRRNSPPTRQQCACHGGMENSGKRESVCKDCDLEPNNAAEKQVVKDLHSDWYQAETSKPKTLQSSTSKTCADLNSCCSRPRRRTMRPATNIGESRHFRHKTNSCLFALILGPIPFCFHFLYLGNSNTSRSSSCSVACPERP